MAELVDVVVDVLSAAEVVASVVVELVGSGSDVVVVAGGELLVGVADSLSGPQAAATKAMATISVSQLAGRGRVLLVIAILQAGLVALVHQVGVRPLSG